MPITRSNVAICLECFTKWKEGADLVTSAKNMMADGEVPILNEFVRKWTSEMIVNGWFDNADNYFLDTLYHLLDIATTLLMILEQTSVRTYCMRAALGTIDWDSYEDDDIRRCYLCGNELPYGEIG